MDRVVRFLAVVLTAVAVAGGAFLRAGTPPPPDVVDTSLLPESLDGRRARDIPVDEATREQLDSDAMLLRAYEAPTEPPIWLLMDYHRTQGLGSTIHSPRICYPGAGWTVVASEISTQADDPICWLRLVRGNETMIALYWYESRWGVSARETTLKLHIVRSAMARRPSDAALFRLSTPVDDADEATARARLLAFRTAAVPATRAAFPLRESSP